MESKTDHNKNQTGQSEWKEIVQGFVTKMLERIGDNVSQRMHTFFSQLKKRTIGGILMLVGSIFLLVSLAILINSVLGGRFQWVGWSLVGIVIVATGYVVTKE